VQANLTISTSNAFATTKDSLENPYQTVIGVTGIRLYTYLRTGATVRSTVTGLSSSPTASQRFYPYTLLASGPGVYSMSTAPFLDAGGISYAVFPAIPANGAAPATSGPNQYLAATVAFTTGQTSALLTDGPYNILPVSDFQQQYYILS